MLFFDEEEEMLLKREESYEIELGASTMRKRKQGRPKTPENIEKGLEFRAYIGKTFSAIKIDEEFIKSFNKSRAITHLKAITKIKLQRNYIKELTDEYIKYSFFKGGRNIGIEEFIGGASI